MGTDRDEVHGDRLVTIKTLPEAPIRGAVLSHELVVGQAPVRDALKRLALEMLVVIYPRRGPFGSENSVATERWLTEARMAPEGLAAGDTG
jgi:DNA-binding GntR family transcriptional regulator